MELIGRGLFGTRFYNDKLFTPDVMMYSGYALFIFGILALKKSIQALFLMISSFAWLGYIFIFVYGAYYRHLFFFIVFIVFSLWICRTPEKLLVKTEDGANLKKQPWTLSLPFGYMFKMPTAIAVLAVVLILNISSAASLSTSYKYDIDDITMPFSQAKAVGDFIKAHHLENKTIIGYHQSLICSICPYLPNTKFWFPQFKDYATYQRWDSAHINSLSVDLSLSDMIRITKQNFSNLSDVLIIVDHVAKQDDEGKKQLEMIYPSAWSPILTEAYTVYKFK